MPLDNGTHTIKVKCIASFQIGPIALRLKLQHGLVMVICLPPVKFETRFHSLDDSWNL